MNSTHIDDYTEIQAILADPWPVFHIIGRDGKEHGSSRSPVTALQIADNIGGHVQQNGKPLPFFGGSEDDLTYLPTSMVKCTKENEMKCKCGATIEKSIIGLCFDCYLESVGMTAEEFIREQELDLCAQDCGDTYDLCRVCGVVEVLDPLDTCEGCRQAREEGLYPPGAEYHTPSEDVPGAWNNEMLQEEVGW